MLPKQKSLSLFKQNEGGFEVLVELCFQTFEGLVDNVHVAVSELIYESAYDHSPQLAVPSQHC